MWNQFLGIETISGSTLTIQTSHEMPNLKDVKSKIDAQGINLKKLLNSRPLPVVHQGLPYNQLQIRPKVGSLMYNVMRRFSERPHN